MSDLAGAVVTLCSALGGNDPEMDEMLAVFSRCSRAYDAAIEARRDGDEERSRRIASEAEELRKQHIALSAAYRRGGEALH